MPKKSSRDTLLRQWSMLKLLPSRGSGLPSSEIRKRLQEHGYEVDVRTVQRDLVQLSQCFPLRCNDRSVPHGWLWAPDAGVDIPCMSVPGALTMKMVEEYLRPILPASVLRVLQPHIDHATRVLSQMDAGNTVASWTDKVRVVHPAITTLAGDIDADVLENIQDALMRGLQVEVAYQRLGSEQSSSLRLHPQALVQRGPVLYLIASAFDYEDVRIYALHRCHSVRILDEAAQRPPGFSIDEFIKAGRLHFGSGELIDLHLWVSAELAGILRESPLCEGMRLQPVETGYELHACLPWTWQLKWWLLSQGAAVRVLAPATVRAGLLDELRATLAAYSEETVELASVH